MTRLRFFSRHFSVLAIAFSLFLAGCQSQSNQGHIDDIPMDRRVGIVKSLGGIKTTSGTHILQMDDGSTMLLKSLQINLDEEKYLNVTVEVRGVVSYTTDEKPLMEVMNIDVLDQPEFVIDNKPKWQEFSNTDLGVAVQYRDDLKVSLDDGDSVSFENEFLQSPASATQESGETDEETTSLKTAKHRFEIVRSALAGGDFMAFLKNKYSDLKSDSLADLQAVGLTKTRVGAHAYDVIKEEKESVTKYYLQSGAHVYTITIDIGADEKTTEDQKTFFEMLGSLEVMPSTDSPSVTQETSEANTQQTSESKEVSSEEGSTQVVELPPVDGYSVFESESLGFSMQYPKKWFFSGKAPNESGVTRHYDFGGKSVDSSGESQENIEIAGVVALDIMSSGVPSGSTVSAGGKSFTKVSSGSNVQYFYTGASGRIYRVSGPSAQESTLLQMASSIKES